MEQSIDPQAAAAKQMHYRLQLGCYFTVIYTTNRARFAYCDLVNDFVWNHACFVSTSADKCEAFIDDVVEFYTSRDRLPCVYISPWTHPPTLVPALEARSFRCLDKEAWMFFNGDLPLRNSREDLEITAVNGTDHLERFVAILTACFPKDYGQAVRREFNQTQVHKKVKHLLATERGQVCGIGSLYWDQGYAVIHNVATLPHCRKQGVATTIVGQLLALTKKEGIETTYLQCVGEGDTEQFYAQLGFQTGLRRLGYVLGSPSNDHGD